MIEEDQRMDGGDGEGGGGTGGDGDLPPGEEA